MRALVIAAALVAPAVLCPATFPSVATPVQSASAPSLEVDYDRSVLVAKLKKGGFLRFLGHEHGIVADSWTAEVRYDPDDLAASSITVEVETGSLVIDSEEARRLAGVDPDGPGADDVREIRADMLSDEQLDAAAFPQIRFESSALERRSRDELRIDGTLTLHGISRELGIDATIEPLDDGYMVRGDFEIEQRDFGIEPVSIGGVVNVANEVEIRFEVYAR